MVKDEQHSGVVLSSHVEKTSHDELDLGTATVIKASGNLDRTHSHSLPYSSLAANPVQSPLLNAVPVAVDSSERFSWPDESDSPSALRTSTQRTTALSSLIAASDTTAGVKSPGMIEGYEAPFAVDVLDGDEPHQLDSLDSYDSRVLAMTLRDMANADTDLSVDITDVSSSTAVLASEENSGAVERSHLPEEVNSRRDQSSAENEEAHVQSASSDSPASSEHNVYDRPPYMGERSWDCSLCSTSNIDLRSSSGAAMPQWWVAEVACCGFSIFARSEIKGILKYLRKSLRVNTSYLKRSLIHCI